MAGYLADIVDHHRRAAAVDGRDLRALARRAEAATGSLRDFAGAVRSAGGTTGLPAVIAEVKRRSPSKGVLAPDLDPRLLAQSYERGGAACLSVLTDEAYFGGSPDDLRAARAACALPVLRKDFTVCEADVYDARLMGADALLLIVAALSDAELRRLRELAGSLGLEALVEVHDEAELARALDAGTTLVGVNQRDLRTFEVDSERAVRVRALVPPGLATVAESGITSPADLCRLGAAGFDAVLVGEALVISRDPQAALGALRGGHSAGGHSAERDALLSTPAGGAG